MLEIINLNADPFYNLALEEYCLDHFLQQDIFILWQNMPAVIIGRNQNTREEINSSYVKEKDIKVVRRLSGGGAVYHDRGNLNFTFIVNEGPGARGFDFTRFTRPVITALAQLGVQAEDNGRNDITIAGKKISGNAQYRRKNRLLHHGTLLFASDLQQMVQALDAPPEKILSKGVKSIRSRVTNIAEHLPAPMDIMTFKHILTATIFSGRQQEQYCLSATEVQAVKQLQQEKYENWEFVYGSSPPFSIEKKARFDWGSIKIQLNIKNGRIKTAAIYGDFFADKDVEELAWKMGGLKYEESSLKTFLDKMDIADYLPAATKEDFIRLLID